MTMTKGTSAMAKGTLGRTATMLVCQMILAAGAIQFAGAAQRTPEPVPASGLKVVASELGSSFLQLGKGKSIVVDLPRDIKDVLVADPKIANAVIRTVRRAYIIGMAAGATNIVFFDAEGNKMANYEIAVARDVKVIRTAIQKFIPGAKINVESIGDGIVLTGFVQTPMEAQQAYEIASHFIEAGDGFFSNVGSAAAGPGGGYNQVSIGSNASNGSGVGGSSAKIVNAIVVRGREQVMLRVTVAEMDREVIKQFGVNLNGSIGTGSTVVNFNTQNPFSANGGPLSPTSFAGTWRSVTATLQAMERAGVTRVLAEPTLTAISGEKATFLAGGQFPYPVPPQTVGGAAGIDFYKFGVTLSFIPVVLSEGRISLNVLTEVSELAPENSVTVVGTTVPGLTVRRAESTVEIPSGGSLAMAGMIREETKHQINGIPTLMQVPILGTLFKSRDYINSQTELMVIVTPYVVQAVAQNKLSRPDDGFADAPDPSAILLSRLNRLYGTSGPAGPIDPLHSYRGNYGFILD
jgi:pilus assembly protein CpaC